MANDQRGPLFQKSQRPSATLLYIAFGGEKTDAFVKWMNHRKQPPRPMQTDKTQISANDPYLLVLGRQQVEQHRQRREQEVGRRLRLPAAHVAQRPHAVPLKGRGRRLHDVQEEPLQGVGGPQNNVAERLWNRFGVMDVRVR